VVPYSCPGVEDHYERCREFFGARGIAIDDPLGEFRTREVPDAPSTPEKLDRAEHPHAEGGFADDVYVEDADGEVVVGGRAEPSEVDVGEAPGLSEEDAGA
jgi:hypothetical protein